MEKGFELCNIICKYKMGNVYLKDVALGDLVKHVGKVLSRQCVGLAFWMQVGGAVCSKKVDRGHAESWGTEWSHSFRGDERAPC